jgi:acylphosphatase
MPGLRVHITGIVQGVGFRPFVYNLAVRFNLKGWVKNTSAGVDIEADGEQDVLDAFVSALQNEAPPLSCIDELTASFGPTHGFRSFDILHSEVIASAFQPISPDMAICDDCLRELVSPLFRIFPMIAPKRPWLPSPCARTANVNTPTPPIDVFIRSLWHARYVDRKFGWRRRKLNQRT